MRIPGTQSTGAPHPPCRESATMSVFAQVSITAYPYQLKAGGMLDQRSTDTRCQSSVSGRNGEDRNNINPSQTRVLTLHRQFE